jgi:hypothetical protein
MAGVGAIGPGPLLGPAARRRLGRLGQMHPGADRFELLDHEAPARRRLQRHLNVAAAKASSKPPHALAVGRSDARAADLAGRRLDPLGGDLRSVLVESHYDRHSGPPHAPRSKRLRGHVSRLS